jgi:O-antigen/teichoic acid export membrane protein
MQRSRRVVRNISSTLITQVLSWAVTFCMIPYVARYIGDAGNGEINASLAYATFFSLFYGIVSGFVLIRDIARDPKRLPELVCASLAVRIPVAILTLCVGLGIAVACQKPLSFSGEMISLIGIVFTLNIVGQVNDALISALRGVEEFPQVNAGQLAEKIAVNVLVISFIHLHKPIEWILGAAIASAILQLVINLRSIAPYWSGFVAPTSTAIKSLITQSIPFISTAYFMTLYSQSDPFYLHVICGNIVTGWYSLSSKILGSCIALPAAVVGAALPTLSRLYHEDSEKFNKFIRQMVGLMIIAVVPFSAVMIFAAVPVLRIWNLAHDYDGAAPAIAMTGFTIFLWFLTQVVGTGLIASDRQHVFGKSTAIAAGISVPSCIGLIWLTQRLWGNGAVGACLSDGLVEFTLLRAYVKALPPGCTQGQSVSQIFRALLAAVPIVAPFYFFHFGRLTLLTAIPGAIAYIPLCMAFKAIDRSEVQHLLSLLRKQSPTETDNAPVELPGTESAVVGSISNGFAAASYSDNQLLAEGERFELAADEHSHHESGPSSINVAKNEPEEAA